MKKIAVLIASLCFFTVLKGQVRVQGTLPSPTDISYSTLKGAFDAINNGIHKGSIVISLGTGDNQIITETAMAVLNMSGSGSASYSDILISPVFSNITITGSINGTGALDVQGIVKLNGAQNVTIDGRTGASGAVSSLTIENSNTGSYANTLSFFGASSNLLRYCTVKSSARSSLNGCGTLSFINNGTAGSSNNTLEYCTITKSGTNFPKTALASSGSSVGKNINNIVRYCTFNDFTRFGIWLGSSNSSSSGYNESWIIDNNTFYQTSAITINATDFSNYAISVGYHDSGATTVKNNETGTFTITNNLIGGNGAGGNWTVNSSTANSGLVVGGIYFGGSTTGYSDISGNVIKDFNVTTYVNTNTVISGFNGIYVYHSKVKIGNNAGNSIHDITLDHKSTWGGVISGITVKNNANYNCEINNNQVYNITALSGTSYFQFFYGIYDWAESSVFDDIITNNRVTNINVNLNSNCFGIHASGMISRNHVSNINVINGTANLTGIYFVGVTTANRPNLRVENNEVILGLDKAGISTAQSRSIYGVYLYGIGYAYYNSVLIQGVHTGSSNTCDLYLSNSSGTGFNAVDNLLYNSRAGGTGKHYCIMTNSANAITSSNNAYVQGTGANNFAGCWNSVDKTTLSLWAAAASELNSISETVTNKPLNIFFPSLSGQNNLNVSDSWLCAGKVTLTTADFINVPRSGTDPTTIGAYEQGCGTLPVSIGDFDAECTDGSIKLVWKTFSETNNDYFILEKTTDLQTWKEIVRIKGAGNSNTPVSYLFFDELVANDAVYFRLKQSDYDGNFSYSEIISPELCTGQDENEMSIYPNPFSTELNLDVSGLKGLKIDVRILDVMGKTIYLLKNIEVDNKPVKLAIAESMEPGIYFIEIISSGISTPKKVIKI